MITYAGFVGLLVDASLKAMLLATVASAGMWIVRVRSTSVRHRVWTAVLAGMIAMPLLVSWTPHVPAPTWTYPDLQFDDGDAATAMSQASPFNTTTSTDNRLALEPTVVAPKAQPSETIDIAETSTAPPPVVETPARSWHLPWLELVVVCYAFGVVFFAARLLVGLVAAHRLVHTAWPVQLSPQHAVEVGRIRVLESSRVRVPLTVGWLRPVIVLPGDWSSWSAAMLAAVLAHEQAHVRRRDPWVALAAQANRAVYWFHPLSWFLARRLTALAEQACDDAVIESLGDRSGYARHLLTIAGRLAGKPRRVQPLGVSMAARPAVEHRIEAILDTARPLARRVGWLCTSIVLTVVAALAVFTASIVAEDQNSAVPSTEPPVRLASDTGTLILTVLDDNGQPIPSADVRIRVRQAFMGSDTWANEKTDDAERLVIKTPEPTPHLFSVKVVKPGYAPFLGEWENREAPNPIPAEYTVWLDPARTIGGVVHDSEGKPIEGVSVAPFFNIKLREERTHQMGAGVNVKTDAAGEWTYASMPADIQQVPITFTHSEYVPERVTEPVSKLTVASGEHPTAVTVLKRGIHFGGNVTDGDGAPLEGATVTYFRDGQFSSSSPTAKTDQQGAFRFTSGQVGDALLTVSRSGFAPEMRRVPIAEETEPIDFQLTKGNPLRVRVVGPDQKPLEGVYVSLWNWDDEGVYGSVADSRGKTDADGNWRWLHAPAGTLQFDISCQGFSYVRGRPLTPGEDNVVVMSPETIVESRVLKVSGRVVDSATGAPIARFRSTPGYLLRRGETPRWLHDAQSGGRDGLYRREFTPNDLARDMYALALRIEAEGYAPATEQFVLGDEDTFAADFRLDKAADEGFRVLMSDGKPAAGATVAVCTPTLGPTVQDGILADYSPCERATCGSDGRVNISPQQGLFGLMVVHESGAAYASPGLLAQSRTITLQPWARVEGTLRMRGKPAANEHVTLSRDEAFQSGMPQVHYDYKSMTDENGKFAFERVVPGRGQVARVAVSQQGGGMTSWTPTHVTNAEFLPGKTTHVDVGRAGRKIVGKLLLPTDAKPGNDWRLARVTLQWNSPDKPKPPKVPYPLGMDPQKDQDAARIWWEQWRYTDQGKQFQQEFKRFAEASSAFKPVHYMARVERDGTFSFDDMPSGDYRLTVRASAATVTVLGGPNEETATLEHTFSIPEAEPGRADAKGPIDLGELTLKAIEPPKPQTEAKLADKVGATKADSKQGVRGRVVMESDGQPVANADVRLVTWNKDRTRYDTQKTRSDIKGEFAFEKVPPGENELAAFFDVFASRKSLYKGEAVRPTADGSYAPVTLKLAQMPEIVVRVVDKANGQPIAGANARLVWCDTERDHKTSERGETTLQRLTHEVWHVEVKAAGFAQQVQAINLAETDAANVTFELVPGGKVFGAVRDEAGKPIAGAGISVFPADFRGGQIEYLKTDSAGKYEFGNLPVDVDMVFMVSHDGFLETRPNVSLASASNREQQLDLVLKRRPDGGSVRGTITDGDGRPIAGAEISNSGRSSRDVRRASSDERGVFVLHDVFEGSVGHELVVKAKDYAPQRLAFTPGARAESAELEIKMEPGHRIRGRVVDEGGEPVAGVRVYSSHGNEGGNMEFGQSVTTDAAGRFAFDSLPDHAPLSFIADGYSEIAETSLPLDGDEDAVVTMLSAGIIRGRVVDAVDGKPISSFSVMITFSPDRRPGEPGHHLVGARATSPDGERFSVSDGTFVLNDLVRDMPLQLTVVSAGFDRQTLRRVLAKSAKEAETAEFRLTPIDQSKLIEIGGQIVDEQLRPIPAAELRLIVARKRSFPRDAFPFNWQMIRRGNLERVDGVLQYLATTSDGDGRFAFREVQPGPDLEIAYWGEGASQGRLEHVERLTSRERENLSIHAVTPGIVRGGIDRQAVPNVTSVILTGRQPANAGEYYQTEVPSNQTEYEIRNIPPGNYQLQVNGARVRTGVDGFDDKPLQRRQVTVASGETVTVDIGTVPPASVGSSPTAPKKNAVRTAATRDTRPPDKVVSTATPTSTAASVTVSGRVVDESERPIVSARLWLPVKYEAGSNDPLTAEAATDRNGAFSFSVSKEWLKPGNFTPLWTIWCYAPGKQIAAASAYRALKGDGDQPIIITLKNATDTAFTVTGPDDLPIAGARVEPWHYLTPTAYQIVPLALRQIIGGETDVKGHVAMPGMPREGFSTVQVSADGFGIQQMGLNPSANEPTVRNIALRATGRIEGRLTSDLPDAIANVRLYVYQEDFSGQYTSGTATLRSDASGHFSVEHFAEGPIEIVIWGNEHFPLRPMIPANLEVFAGETTDVTIPYVPAIRVRGMVRAKDGHQPVPGALVSVMYGSFYQGDRVRTDQSGAFETLVPPGPVRQQLIMRPDKFGHWTESELIWSQPSEVPAELSTFDLPPIELVETFEHFGRLIDKAGEPVPGARLSAVVGNRNLAMAETEADGSFRIWLPEEPAIDSYNVHISRDEPRFDATIVGENPFVLRVDR